MTKLLVLAATSSQIPIIKTAKRLGCYVGVVDMDENAAAIEHADEYFQCSLTDMDGLNRIADSFCPDGITCGASDVGVVTAAAICEKRGLPGLPVETAHKVKDKGAMIEAFRARGVAHPEYRVVESAEEEIDLAYPLITKPVDNCGSRGINMAKNKEELRRALEDSLSRSDAKRAIVQEYLIGPEVSVEIVVQDGQTHIVQVTDKLTTGAPHFTELGHSQPSRLPAGDLDAIRSLACEAVGAVGIKDGNAHAEIILTSQGPKMVEIAGRLGADFITTVLVPISTGVDMGEYEVLRAIGRPAPFTPPSGAEKGAAVRFIEFRPGRLSSVEIDQSAGTLAGVEEMKVSFQSDRLYGEAEHNRDRFGYVIASGDTAEEAVRRCETALSGVRITMR